MLTKARWKAECLLIAKHFPEFAPFEENGTVGFYGHLRGPQTGCVYAVTTQAPARTYPAWKPAIYMDPHAERQHWREGGQLDFVMRWDPAPSTFASTLLFAIKYLHEFDGFETTETNLRSPARRFHASPGGRT